MNDNDMQNEELCRINQCRKLLLEAGADPTLDLSQGYTASFLEETCIDANPVRQFFDFLDFVKPQLIIKIGNHTNGLEP